MKKILAVAVIIILAFVVLILFGGKKEDDSNYFKTISVKEFERMIDKKKDFVLVFSQDGCSHCEEFLPVLEKIANNNKYKIYNINLTKLSASDKQKIIKNYDVKATPTTILVKNGKEDKLNRITRGPSYDEMTEKLKDLGYLK